MPLGLALVTWVASISSGALSLASEGFQEKGKCLLQKTTVLQFTDNFDLGEIAHERETNDNIDGYADLRASSVEASMVAHVFQTTVGDLAKPPAGKHELLHANEEDVYFRPVSMTIFCSMWLTIQSLVIHTSVAVMKNADELSAKTVPSFFTEVLETAARTVPIAPMICLLFVANRFFMLMQTDFKGETALWIQISVLAATAGLTGQLLVAFLLALTTERSSSSASFSELSGAPNDAFPQVLPHRYKIRGARAVILVIHSTSLFCLFGGVFAVAFRIASTIQIASYNATVAAVSGTAALVLLYVFVSISLWATSINVLGPHCKERAFAGVSALRTAAEQADIVVQKAPMFAVLFVATRLRAVDDNVHVGVPPTLVVASFPVAVAALVLEVFIAACTDCDEDGAPRTATANALQHVQHLLTALGFGATFFISISVFRPWGQAATEPMSPTIQSVMALFTMFFVVHFLLALYSLIQYALKLSSTRAKDALLTARNSLGCCPLLCTLFLGCRMRALQISQGIGMPQWWEQDCLYICVCATLLEVICCITVPVFFSEAGVDSQGNVTTELKSITTAYTVTMVRYVALIGLHSGTIGICLAIASMTPESVVQVGPEDISLWRAATRVLLITMLILMAAAVLSSAKVIGLIVKLAIESVDMVYLNTQINVDTAVLSLCGGYVIVKGLVVCNPEGEDETDPLYKSAYLLKVDVMSVRISVWRMIKSFGKDIEIIEIIVTGLDLMYEKGSGGHLSNVGTLLEFLEGPKDEKEKKKKQAGKSGNEAPKKEKKKTLTQSASTVSKSSIVSDQSGNVDESGKHKSKGLVIKRVLIKDIVAQVIHPSLGSVARLDLGTMDFKDFSTRQHQVGDIVALILQTFLKTALTNTHIMALLLKQGTTQCFSSLIEKGRNKCFGPGRGSEVP